MGSHRGPEMQEYQELVGKLRDQGCQRLFIKRLAKNDNSKQQVYLASSFDVLKSIPHSTPVRKEGTVRETWHTDIPLSWMDEDGKCYKAPFTKAILYPKYPEIRLSGFLRGCKVGPNEIMTSRAEGRLLFLGIRHESDVIAFVCHSTHNVARTMEEELDFEGVFTELPLLLSDSGLGPEEQLLRDLSIINKKGWIEGKRMNGKGDIVPCNAQNAIGYTLEAELEIRANGLPGPDKLGREIKGFTARKWDKLPSKPVSLITTEPDGGYYVEHGLPMFLDKYGYIDEAGNRRYGGIHRIGERGRSSKNKENLTLRMSGFDGNKGTYSLAEGRLYLEDRNGETAASWSFSHLHERWTTKHNKTVFVPALADKSPTGIRSYHYGDRVTLGYDSGFDNLLSALESGVAYLDPSPVIRASGAQKKRSMFRVNMKNVSVLFDRFEERML